eukprot:SAG11_NODE_1591_length_4618_cov_3.431069_5_plen_78_part_01
MTLVPPMVALAAAQGTCPEIAQAISGHGDALRQPSRTLVFFNRVPFMGSCSRHTTWALAEGPMAHNGAVGRETDGSCH